MPRQKPEKIKSEDLNNIPEEIDRFNTFSNEEDIPEDLLIKAKINSLKPLKFLIDAIKTKHHVLNLIFHNNRVESTSSINGGYDVLLLNLYPCYFNFYYNRNTPTCIAIRIEDLWRVLSSVCISTDTLKLVARKNKKKIKFTIGNCKTGSRTKFKIPTADPVDETEINEQILLEDRYDKIFVMAAYEFNNICKRSKKIFENIKIKVVDDVFSIKTINSESFSMTIDLKEKVKKKYYMFKKNEHKEQKFSQVYSLKDIQLFSKCLSVTKTIWFYCSRDETLIIRYNIPNLGNLIYEVRDISQK